MAAEPHPRHRFDAAGPPRAVGLMERMRLLRSHPLLASLSGPHLALVASAAHEPAFPRGGLVLAEGETPGALHFVVDGAVRLSRHGRYLDTVGPGAVVGDVGLAAGARPGAEARAETPALTLELTRDVLVELLEDDFGLLLEMIRRASASVVTRLAALDVAPMLPARARPPLAFPERELDFVERLFLVRRMPGLEAAGVDALSELVRELEEVRLPPATPLWSAGAPSSHFLLVIGGAVQCSRPGGWTTRVRALAPVGLLEAIAAQPRWFDATTASELVALRGDPEALLDILEDDGETAIAFLTHLAGDLRGDVASSF